MDSGIARSEILMKNYPASESKKKQHIFDAKLIELLKNPKKIDENKIFIANIRHVKL